jgi:hypothetical protein
MGKRARVQALEIQATSYWRNKKIGLTLLKDKRR